MVTSPLLMLALAGAGPVECRSLDLPKRLPTVAELIDSAALAASFTGEPVILPPEVRLGVAFPRPAGPPQAWMIDSGVTPDAEARVAVLVQASLRRAGAPAGTTLRLDLVGTTPIGLRVRRSVLCDPVPLDSAISTQPAVGLVDGASPAPPERWRAVIRQRIGTEGQVLDARLQPGSGRPEIDRVALLPVFARRWRPATLDGRPVGVWFANGRSELAR